MSEYAEYFLNSRSSVVALDLFEITHPDFNETYRIVRNAPAGVTVDLSDDETEVAFVYYPANVERLGISDDLDQAIRVDLGDLGEVIPREVDAVAAGGGFLTKPAFRYWSFRSDDLSAPMLGPIRLEVPAIAFTEEGASLEAQAPSKNSTKTGERFTIERFPMLRGFVN